MNAQQILDQFKARFDGLNAKALVIIQHLQDAENATRKAFMAGESIEILRTADALATARKAHEVALIKPTEEEVADLFAQLLAAEDFSHVTSGHAVSPNSFHVYRRDASSPSGCQLVRSFSKTERNAAVLAASQRRATLGGQRGSGRF